MNSKGLTLLELLVALSIAAVLLAVAVPGFGSWLAQNRLQTATFDLLTDLNMARSEAVKRGVRVGLWNRDGSWSSGWVIFVDDNGDGTRQAAETLLFERRELPAGVRISGNLHVTSMVSYLPSGQTRTPNGAYQIGTLQLCAERVDSIREIAISRGGRPRTATLPGDGSCAD